MRTLVVNEHPHMLPFRTPPVSKQTGQITYMQSSWLCTTEASTLKKKTVVSFEFWAQGGGCGRSKVKNRMKSDQGGGNPLVCREFR
jgi:hypothetical protein